MSQRKTLWLNLNTSPRLQHWKSKYESLLPDFVCCAGASADKLHVRSAHAAERAVFDRRRPEYRTQWIWTQTVQDSESRSSGETRCEV